MSAVQEFGLHASPNDSRTGAITRGTPMLRLLLVGVPRAVLAGLDLTQSEAGERTAILQFCVSPAGSVLCRNRVHVALEIDRARHRLKGHRHPGNSRPNPHRSHARRQTKPERRRPTAITKCLQVPGPGRIK